MVDMELALMDLNHRMQESKSCALPLGETPLYIKQSHRHHKRQPIATVTLLIPAPIPTERKEVKQIIAHVFYNLLVSCALFDLKKQTHSFQAMRSSYILRNVHYARLILNGKTDVFRQYNYNIVKSFKKALKSNTGYEKVTLFKGFEYFCLTQCTLRCILRLEKRKGDGNHDHSRTY